MPTDGSIAVAELKLRKWLSATGRPMYSAGLGLGAGASVDDVIRVVEGAGQQKLFAGVVEIGDRIPSLLHDNETMGVMIVGTTSIVQACVSNGVVVSIYYRRGPDDIAGLLSTCQLLVGV